MQKVTLSFALWTRSDKVHKDETVQGVARKVPVARAELEWETLLLPSLGDMLA